LGYQSAFCIGGAGSCASSPSRRFPGYGHHSALEEEIRRVRRELERVQQEREMLKKPLGIFSRGQP
jgi:transposase